LFKAWKVVAVRITVVISEQRRERSYLFMNFKSNSCSR